MLAVTAYTSRVAVHRAAEAREIALNREVERLDFLQKESWQRATEPTVIDRTEEGDPIYGWDDKAANFVLKVIMARAKLLGLDQPVEDTSKKVTTIVIDGTSEEYIAGLKALQAEPE